MALLIVVDSGQFYKSVSDGDVSLCPRGGSQHGSRRRIDRYNHPLLSPPGPTNYIGSAGIEVLLEQNDQPLYS